MNTDDNVTDLGPEETAHENEEDGVSEEQLFENYEDEINVPTDAKGASTGADSHVRRDPPDIDAVEASSIGTGETWQSIGTPKAARLPSSGGSTPDKTSFFQVTRHCSSLFSAHRHRIPHYLPRADSHV